MKSARAGGRRFWLSRKFWKRRNTLCTRKGYAASVSQLTLATAALYSPLSELHGWGKRFAAQPKTIYSEVPKVMGGISWTARRR